MKIMKVFWIIIGSLALALGTIGIFLPVLPTVPFYMLTVFAFANSSEKLHKWFLSTRMYKNYLENYVEKKGMTIKTKLTLLITVTLLMGFGFFMMKSVPIGRIILAIVWIGHIIYFGFIVKTISQEEELQIKKEKLQRIQEEKMKSEEKIVEKNNDNNNNNDKVE